MCLIYSTHKDAHYKSLDARKLLGVSDRVRHKSACTVTDVGQMLEIVRATMFLFLIPLQRRTLIFGKIHVKKTKVLYLPFSYIISDVCISMFPRINYFLKKKKKEKKIPSKKLNVH